MGNCCAPDKSGHRLDEERPSTTGQQSERIQLSGAKLSLKTDQLPAAPTMGSADIQPALACATTLSSPVRGESELLLVLDMDGGSTLSVLYSVCVARRAICTATAFSVLSHTVKVAVYAL